LYNFLQATCTNLGPKYKCDCLPGFEGLYCEININECDTVRSPCNAEGTDICEDLINNFRCHCRPGYTGDRCEIHIDRKSHCFSISSRLDCASEPCKNGACVQGVSKYRCDCKSGWKGEQCEIEAGKCEQTPSPCQNNGTCLNLFDGDYFCVWYIYSHIEINL
jgi:Notch-like protein